VDEDVFYNINIVYYKTKDIVGEFHGKQSSILDYFDRIGQYDFTKKDKIEQIPMPGIVDSWSHERSIISKVNELVDAVNRLKEKVNEMA
jgi:hypothetical protein